MEPVILRGEPAKLAILYGDGDGYGYGYGYGDRRSDARTSSQPRDTSSDTTEPDGAHQYSSRGHAP